MNFVDIFSSDLMIKLLENNDIIKHIIELMNGK